jgi:Flp pilus assembly protein TadG
MRLPAPPARSPHRAAAVVEFALVAPFFVAALLGMFEISRAILVKEVLSNAAQRAARTGSRPGTSNTDLTQDVDAVLSASGISGYSTTILVNDVSVDVNTAVRYDKVSVKVAVPASNVFWVSTFFLTGSTVESETVVMMRQG